MEKIRMDFRNIQNLAIIRKLNAQYRMKTPLVMDPISAPINTGVRIIAKKNRMVLLLAIHRLVSVGVKKTLPINR
jgi:hypothetical protein